jgi:hypothetical protein
MSHIDRKTTMADNFEQPNEAIVDGQHVTQHNLKDQIAMDKHLTAGGVGKTTKKKNLGLLLRRMSPPGTV